MRILKPLILGLCVGASAAAAASAGNILVAERAQASWVLVPDSELAKLRGGIDFGQGNLVAYFAIARTVAVNGQVVAQMQLVISNLGALGSGGQPQISVTGPLAQLIQVLNANPASTDTGAAATVAPALAVLPAAPAATAASSVPGPASSPASTASSSPGVASGSVSSPDVQTGSTAQFGSALSSAVAAANGALGGPPGPTASIGSSPASAPAATRAPTPVQASPVAEAQSGTPGSAVVQAGPAPRAAPAPSSAVAPATPVVSSSPGSGGVVPVIVISNLPNATAITTAVQNDVHATTIQTQTTITATLSSLTVTNALALANAIQSQVAASLGH